MITSAGIVLAGTFSVLAVLPLVFLTEIGFVVAFGVLLDTFLVRSVLVPRSSADRATDLVAVGARAEEEPGACRSRRERGRGAGSRGVRAARRRSRPAAVGRYVRRASGRDARRQPAAARGADRRARPAPAGSRRRPRRRRASRPGSTACSHTQRLRSPCPQIAHQVAAPDVPAAIADLVRARSTSRCRSTRWARRRTRWSAWSSSGWSRSSAGRRARAACSPTAARWPT